MTGIIDKGDGGGKMARVEDGRHEARLVCIAGRDP